MWEEDYFILSAGVGTLGHSAWPRNGRAYVMYYGTSRFAAKQILDKAFRQSRRGIMLGAGVYVTRDIQKACKYPLGVSNSKRRVLKVRVDVGKVKIIDQQDHPMQETWHTEHGYDTAWVPPGVDMVESNRQENFLFVFYSLSCRLNPSLGN
uniref:Uncharacterized protein n=1 Tax=Hucho hucho TaxID=62062 RepID=A0A4W5N2U3_9TELE